MKLFILNYQHFSDGGNKCHGNATFVEEKEGLSWRIQVKRDYSVFSPFKRMEIYSQMNRRCLEMGNFPI